jgi:hypothetical protein
MTIDYRALCKELVDELEDWIAYGDEADIADAHLLVDRARTALAQPEAEGPTDEELLQIAASSIAPYESCGIHIGEYEAETERAVEVYGSELITFARATLARWGRPAVEPLERWYPSFANWLEREMPEGTVIGDPLWWASKIATYLQRYGRLAIEPVPVSERLPGPGDCDAEGRCWWWIVDQPGELPHWIYCTLEVLSWTNFTAWLPHYALPTHDPLPRLLALAELERQ